MRRWRISFIVFLVISIGLAGCSATKHKSTMEQIQAQLNKIENYRCMASVIFISNKGRNEYLTKQYYKKTGEYRLEMLEPDTIKGIVTIFDGKTVMQMNPRVEGKMIYPVEGSKDRDEIFLGAFLKNYMQSEEVSIAVVHTDEGKSTVLEAVIPGNHPYLSTEKLWLDNKTLKPTQLVIYDSQGNERMIVKYKEFEYNIALDDAVFRVEPKVK